MLLAVPIRATDKLFAFFRPFLYFLAALPFTGVAFLLAFKGSCHHSPQPGRQKVQQIRSPSWYEMHHETCLRIKLLMTIVIKNLLPQIHFFIVSWPTRACLVLKFQTVGWLCDRQAGMLGVYTHTWKHTFPYSGLHRDCICHRDRQDLPSAAAVAKQKVATYLSLGHLWKVSF